MNIAKLLLATISLALTPLMTAPASAQATRTWVPGTGDDLAACSRAAPCKTFAAAIAATVR